VKDHIVLMTFLLVFYVVYTMWWGFSIFYVFEGLGLSMKRPKQRRKSKEDNMKILVPIDGSRYSREALKVAVEFAKTRGAEICLLNVVSDFTDIDLEISAGERDRVAQAA